MTGLQVVMPMAGLGRRFREVGIDIPKPLIEVDGMPMFERALASFPSGLTTSLTIVIRAQDDAEVGLNTLVSDAHPEANVVIVPHLTRGAAETALAARESLDADAPLVVMDCDIAFVSPEYLHMIREREDLDGLLLTFQSQDPRYSFVEVDDHGIARRTAEKIAISNRAIMGSYFFRRAADFIQIATQMVADGLASDVPELYMSAAMDRLIARGGRVGVAEGDFYCFGTPGELADYMRTGAPVNAMDR